MDVQLNWWAVLLATASSMVVGMVWYARPVFGNTWMKAAGLDPKKMNRSATMPIMLALVMSFLTAFVLAHMSFLANHFYHGSFFHDAVTTAFWVWLGFAMATLVTHYSFENRPAVLTWLNVGNRFVTIMVMGLIIGWLHP